jgi:hypothetical protein
MWRFGGGCPTASNLGTATTSEGVVGVAGGRPPAWLALLFHCTVRVVRPRVQSPTW